MATMQQREVATDSALESYQAIASLVSKEFSKTIKTLLDKLQDPASFQETVSTVAREHGVHSAVMDDPPTLYKAFWDNAAGLQVDTHWLNSAGVPERGSQDVQSFAPVQPPPPTGAPHADFDIGIGGFGFNFGLHV